MSKVLASSTMKLVLFYFPLLLALVLLPSCREKDTHEKAMSDMMLEVEKIVTTVEGVDDMASAETAARTLEGLQGDMEVILARMEAMGDPDEAAKRKLDEKFNPRIRAYEKRIESALMELVKIDLAALEVLREGLSSLEGMNP